MESIPRGDGSGEWGETQALEEGEEQRRHITAAEDQRWLAVVVCGCNPSTLEAQAGGTGIQG